MSTFEPGTRIVERFVVQERLGSGGMASVYRCVDLSTGQEQALKVLHEHLRVDSPDMARRFRLEAQLMLALQHGGNHPNVVCAYELIDAPGVLAFSMEVVEGRRSLAEVLAQQPMLSEGEATQLALQLLAGLEHVHRHHILHRDLKPSNLLLHPDGRLLITDFGIAKHLKDLDDDLSMANTLTQTQSMFGSPAYMAPELFDSVANASVESDLYSVGVILYELLIGVVPFVVDSMPSHVLRVATQAPPSPRLQRAELSGDIERAIAIALAKDPQDRFSDAATFGAFLRGQSAELEASGRLPERDPEHIEEYQVIRRIGRGPNTKVFACKDQNLEVEVAVKLLPKSETHKHQQLLKEARSQAALHQGRPHPHIVAVRNVLHKGSSCALVCELVEGVALQRFLLEARPDLPTVLRLFAEAASALAHAHSKGVLHRNLKPNNLLVNWSQGELAARRKPRVKLADFRLDALNDEPPQQWSQRQGVAIYMAPERLSGASASVATDVYGLAALLLSALREELQPHRPLAEQIPDTSPSLQQILERALAFDPAQRPLSAELAQELEAIASSMTGERQSVAPELILEAPQKRSLGWLVLVSLVVLLGIATAMALVLHDGESEPTAQEEAASYPAPEPLPPVPLPATSRDVSAAVAQLFASKTEIIGYCIKKGLSTYGKPKQAGGQRSLSIKATVSPSGKVLKSEVVHDDLAELHLGECVSAGVWTWSFPASGRQEQWTKEWIF